MTKMKKRNVSIRFRGGIGAAGAVFLPATILLWLSFFPPSFVKVREVEVMNDPPLSHLTEVELIRFSGVQKGDNLITLRLGRVRSSILRFPWIREVWLSRRFPGRLLIAVEEENPSALLEQKGKGKTEFFLVNREGDIFKKKEVADPDDLPLITGLDREDLSSRLKPFVSLIAAFGGMPRLHEAGISELHWDGKKGLSLSTGKPRVQIEMGKGLWEEKLGRLAEGWEMIHATSQKPVLVDLNFDKRIVVKTQKTRGGG